MITNITDTHELCVYLNNLTQPEIANKQTEQPPSFASVMLLCTSSLTCMMIILLKKISCTMWVQYLFLYFKVYSIYARGRGEYGTNQKRHKNLIRWSNTHNRRIQKLLTLNRRSTPVNTRNKAWTVEKKLVKKENIYIVCKHTLYCTLHM